MADETSTTESFLTDARPSFRAFVETEPTLTPEQRSLLVDIYGSWDL